jgi:hypothetical protein
MAQPSDDGHDRVYNPTSYKDWDVEQALADAVSERTLLSTSYEEQTKRHLDQAAPAAAMSIVNIALYSHDERRKLDASKYVVDRLLGRIGEEKQSAQGNPLEALLGDVVRTAEELANGSSYTNGNGAH